MAPPAKTKKAAPGKGASHSPIAGKKAAKAGVDALFASKKLPGKVSKDVVSGNGKKVMPAAADKKNAKKMELDALFSGIKAKKQQKIADDEAVRRQEELDLAEKRAYRKHLEELEADHKRKNNDTSDPRPVRYDADGMAIYTEESLRIGQGNGDTPDCPFDCWCCF
ncbi:Aste57867_13435 [Aphanomyces stellatus]|uniref:Aste57867_13435 protein n=1 Tax=Aphanomyces stellatus TaxID=120398 RepID=A0A485L073_9STRA|nr:hypothetical protein As57867_013385 [Aphanomyces stellatus]VFT90274.1 Aste57867_13435 [Aphanomyces stellatus]